MQTTFRSTPLLVFLLVAFAFCGCGISNKPDVTASDKLVNGNLVVFLNEQIAKNGGLLGSESTTNAPINCRWRFRSDTNGAQIFTDAKFFPEVDHLFRASLGNPDMATENKPGQFFVRFSIRKAGVAIQYTTAPSPFPDVPDPLLHIIILKQQNMKGSVRSADTNSKSNTGQPDGHR